MDFFSAQEQSRRTSRFLVIMFSLATLGIVAAVTALAAALLRIYGSPPGYAGSGNQPWALWLGDHWPELALAAIATLLFIGLASLYRIARLSRGGGQVAQLAGGTAVTPDVTDPLRRRLLNVVEEMAIASGVPVPEVFVLEQESGINAFAAGYTPADAAVAVTRGALEQLDRAELQGVVAHEFSHILNGDMRLNIRLMGLLYGILVLSLVGRWLLRGSRYSGRGRSSGGAAAALMLGLALTVIGALGFFCGRLIKAGVSRQREFLADASAVQFTRDPSGIAGALKKIGGFGSTLTSTDSEEIAHMLFTKGATVFRGLFATHPPLGERIRRLDPAFKPGDYPSPKPTLATASPEPALIPLAPEVQLNARRLTAEQLVGAVGQVGPAQIDFASRVHRSLPEALLNAAHSRDDSVLLALALALHHEPPILAGQLKILGAKIGPARSERCAGYANTLRGLGPQYRLPVLELAFPSLKDRPWQQLQFVLDLIHELVRHDGQLELFEYTLLRVLRELLRDAQRPSQPRGRGRRERRAAAAAAAQVLALVARCGHADREQAESAYRRGLDQLAPGTPSRLPEREIDLDVFDEALSHLASLNDRGRRAVLTAVYGTIAHDQTLTVAEQELLRAVSAALRIPLPPLV